MTSTGWRFYGEIYPHKTLFTACQYLSPFASYIPLTALGVKYPSTVLAKARTLPNKSLWWFLVTLLHTPCFIKHCRVHVNIYFRSLRAWPDVGMKIWKFVDLMSDPAKRLMTKITYYFQLFVFIVDRFCQERIVSLTETAKYRPTSGIQNGGL